MTVSLGHLRSTFKPLLKNYDCIFGACNLIKRNISIKTLCLANLNHRFLARSTSSASQFGINHYAVNQEMMSLSAEILYAKNHNGVKENIHLPAYINQTFILPTVCNNLPMIAYIEKLSILEKIDPTLSNKEISENNGALPVVKKEAAKMIGIRERKMRVHKRKKYKKKYKALLEKIRFRREKRKEQAFQAQLIGQIKEAEMFDAEKYVTDILKKIRERPRPESLAERKERLLDLKRKNRSNVEIIRPKFED